MRRIIVFFAETLLILIIVLCCYIISKLDKMEQSSLDASDIVKPTYQEKEEEYAQEVETGYKNIMILGIDASADESISLSESVRSDVIMICSIDNATKEVKLISVYRDTYLRMMNGDFNKANEQSFRTGVLDAMNMLNTNLDLQIDDYIVVNWATVATVINLLGGIEAEVTDTMLSYKNQINGYITEIVNSTGIGSVQIKEPGYQLLDGVQTVAYARIRYKNGDDYGRTQRQREVISKLLDKAKKASPAKWNSIADAIFPQIATSLDLTEILSMLPNLLKYHITDTAGFPFVSQSIDSPIGPQDVREAVFPVDLKNNVIQLHKILYDKDDYEPSDDVIEINDEIIDQCGLVPSETLFDEESYIDSKDYYNSDEEGYIESKDYYNSDNEEQSQKIDGDLEDSFDGDRDSDRDYDRWTD